MASGQGAGGTPSLPRASASTRRRHYNHRPGGLGGPAAASVASLVSGSVATPLFDLSALFEALDSERERRALSWAALSREIGVAPSTIRRFAGADDAEADGVLATIQWLNSAPEHYVRGSEIDGARLPRASDGHARVDMQRIAEALRDPRGAHGRTRTTIQTLTAAANGSGQPIASLVRVTET